VSVVALTVAAGAADVYLPGPGNYSVPGISWTGLYLGVNGGGARGDVKTSDLGDYYETGAVTKLSPSGAIIGGTLGYNLQRWRTVFGAEVDLGGMDLSAKKLPTGATTLPNKFPDARIGIDSGLYGNVTGRLGYTFGAALLYAKGGFALYDGYDQFFQGTGASFSSATKTRYFAGWTYGGGLEYSLTKEWSLKGEYIHFDLGSEDFTVTSAFKVQSRFKEDLIVDTVKAGVNYHVGSVYAPLR
jgi:outer membrane immunogenic protein